MKKLMSVLLALVFLTGVSLASYDMNGNYSMKFNYVYEEDQNIPQKNSLTFEKVATYVTTGLLIAGVVVLAYLSGSNNSPVPMYDYWANKYSPEACVARSIVAGYSDYSWVNTHGQNYQFNDGMLARFVDIVQGLYNAHQPIR